MILEDATFLIICSVLFLIVASLAYSLAIYFFGRWILRSSLWKKSYKFESIKSNSQELGSLTEGESRLIKKEEQLCFGEVKNLDSRVLFHTLNETDGDIVPLSDFNSQFYLLNKDQNQKKVAGKFGQSMKSKSFSEFGAIKNQDEQHTKISGLKRKVSRISNVFLVSFVVIIKDISRYSLIIYSHIFTSFKNVVSCKTYNGCHNVFGCLFLHSKFIPYINSTINQLIIFNV
ncbi:hypothetical protein BpHYR1_017153 [Brachionus plicatilis]|uniref:Uncharacterized protein n=1 Tax=Brachionus plicatilis TaxID=10195 RepID=A0A3M7RW27_BRAPC|nr:hypothetical protein BpHYR1_017153 [Brachionus plicatilis]